MIKIGIIICSRYSNCAGGKCFRSFFEREGAFAIYVGKEAEIAAFAHCGGCPGGNIEYVPDEMKKNGVTHIHFATGFLVGYPPCPFMEHFEKYITGKYGMEVVFGTHPISQKYYIQHSRLNSWKDNIYEDAVKNTLCDESTRLAYD